MGHRRRAAVTGRCVPLAERVVGASFSSAWEPTPAELEMLKAGGNVVVFA